MMQLDTRLAEIGPRVDPAAEPRLPHRTALFAIFALSVASWVPLILPVVAFVHR